MPRLSCCRWFLILLSGVPLVFETASLAQEATPPADSVQLMADQHVEGEVSIEAAVDSPRIPSNRTLMLTVRATCAGDLDRYEFRWPAPPELERLEIIGSSSGNVVSEDSRGRLISIREFRYILKPVAQGSGRIGSVVLDYADKLSQREYSLSTRAITVDILEPASDGSKRSGAAVMIGCGLLAVLIASGVVYSLERRRRRRVAVETPVETKGPEQKALEKLESLPALRLAGETKEYYSTVSAILRSYIDGRFSLRTTELTTPDIIDQLRLKEIEEETIIEIEKLLRACDMVKFADHQPSPSDLDAIESAARDFFSVRIPVSPRLGDGDGGSPPGS